MKTLNKILASAVALAALLTGGCRVEFKPCEPEEWQLMHKENSLYYDTEAYNGLPCERRFYRSKLNPDVTKIETHLIDIPDKTISEVSRYPSFPHD